MGRKKDAAKEERISKMKGKAHEFAKVRGHRLGKFHKAEIASFRPDSCEQAECTADGCLYHSVIGEKNNFECLQS